MSLGQLLMEDGVEVELNADMKDVIALLDSEVPNFSYGDYGYRISSSRGVLGSEWRLVVNLWDGATSTELTPAVGLIELAKLEGSKVSFKIPPRHRWGDDDASPFDEDGWFFASFVFQLLNAFQTWKLVDLGTQLPIR